MNDPLLHTSTTIIVPIVDSDPQVIDLSVVYQIESRVGEIAFVNKAKAPELLARFNEAYLHLHKIVTFLGYEFIRAQREANKVRAIVILDRAPAILAAKGLLSGHSRSGSEDQRNAVLDQDQEYQQALERTQQIKCFIEFLKGKLEGFEWAYTSVKKILGDNGAAGMLDLNLGSGTGEAPVGRSNPDPMRSPQNKGFGKARY